LFCPCGSTITRLLLDEPLIAAVFSKRVILWMNWSVPSYRSCLLQAD
jgi:hypothetical protein